MNEKPIEYLGLLVLLFIAGCGFVPKSMIPGYQFSMTRPDENSMMAFSDKNIKATFSILEGKYAVYEGVGLKQYRRYEGVKIAIENLSDQPITIDWNRISFEDFKGESGNQVMHQGVKYNQCSEQKSPSVIPPEGKMSDMIIPCYGVNFDSVAGMWMTSFLPSPRQYPQLNFGLFVPLQIGQSTVNYTFKFSGKTTLVEVNKNN